MQKWLILIGACLLVFSTIALIPNQEEENSFDLSYSITNFERADQDIDSLYGRYNNILNPGTTFQERSRFAYVNNRGGIQFSRNSMIRERALAYYNAAGLRSEETGKQSQLGFYRNRQIAETKQKWNRIVNEGYGN